MKKREHNQKRSKPEPGLQNDQQPVETEQSTTAEDERDGGDEFEPSMVSHLQMVTSQIEGRKVSREEILEMLREEMRQQGMVERIEKEYLAGCFKNKPP